MTQNTLVQIHFVKDLINHRLRFGVPLSVLKLDKYRKISVFAPDQIIGYIRWSANKYGTKDWRVYILKTGQTGFQSRVHGVQPAVKILSYGRGAQTVRRMLTQLDRLEATSQGGLETVPESYWPQFQNAILAKHPIRDLPCNHRIKALSHAG